jgi:rare lipoprotein A
VLRTAALLRRVPVAVAAPAAALATAAPTNEAPTTEPSSAVTTTTEAPTTTLQPGAITTTQALAGAEPEAVPAKAPSSGGSEGSATQGGATWYEEAPAGTCAHRTLAFGTVVTVTRLATGASTTCRVQDRGPFVSGMIIDLSMDTFAEIASTDDGISQVQISW